MPAAIFAGGAVGNSASQNTIAFTLPGSIPDGSMLWMINCANATCTVSSISNITETQEDAQVVGTTTWAFLHSAPVGAAESGLTVTITISNSRKQAVGWVIVTDVEAAENIKAYVGDNTVDAAATFPSITPTVDNAFLISLVAGQHPSTTTITADSDWAPLDGSAFGTAGVPEQSAHVGHLQLATGSGTPRSGDAHAWSVNSRDAIWVVALVPTAAALAPSGWGVAA